MSTVVVLGAGVVGLTTALQLIRADPSLRLTVVAKHMPGDYDIEYASPWAGANYLPVAAPGSPSFAYERHTWPELETLARELPEAGVHFQEARVFRRAKDAGSQTQKWFSELLKPDPAFQEFVPDFRALRPDELPEGFDGGSAFTSVCINTALYLPWLASQCLRHGVRLRRGIATHIRDAAHLHDRAHAGPAAVVVNCTGLAARTLGGVADATVYPARGQVVVVRNALDGMDSTSGTDDGSHEACYIMQRAAGGGLVLGGCLQPHNEDPRPDLDLAARIMARCLRLRPDMAAPGAGIEGLDVVRHGVGLRPMREAGIRVEAEVVEGVEGVDVVHNYGHGGYGYQTSYGSAMSAVRLVRELLRKKGVVPSGASPASKL